MNALSLKSLTCATLTFAALSTTSLALAGHHEVSVKAMDQDVSGGTVTASSITADANGWLVVHRTDSNMKPGPVVGYAPLKSGKNKEVTAILQEPVASGDMLMLMLHGEEGGSRTGIFEYTLGAKEDGPVRMDGKLVMDIITAK
ncbi:DUF7282 domain-containing protein [Marinomonas ostreistagni]|uniref:DUF7282 domain-containing protein n=1 Tax=Marinomonas ostreistagni TaxID=359209 RepID=UPI00194E5D20|nr:hypothetical protein [Marinomonas ostreistagni]MBM6552093.1 hypothetical protein [Marinomonas ostreistagni]